MQCNWKGCTCPALAAGRRPWAVTLGKLFLTDLNVFCKQVTGLVDEWTAADVDYLDICKVFGVVSCNWLYRGKTKQMTGTRAQRGGRSSTPVTVIPQLQRV